MTVAICAATLSGCATKQQTYQPPDATKVVAAQHHYDATVAKAKQLATTAHTQTIQTRDAAMRITLIASTAIANLGELEKNIPVAQRPAVHAIMDEVSKLSDELTALVTSLNAVIDTQGKLEDQFAQTERDKAEVMQAGKEYFDNAQHLADDATRENAERIKAEKALSWYRWHWWGSWIAFGVGILACVTLAILKAMGKLAFL